MKERRRSYRQRVYVHGTVIEASGNRTTGHILDMSAHGMLLSTHAPLRSGAIFTFEVDTDARLETVAGLPDVMHLACRVIDDQVDEAMGVSAEHFRCEFTNETRTAYGQMLESLVAGHALGRRRGAPVPPPPPPPSVS